MMQMQERPSMEDPRFIGRFAVEIGARLRRYQDEGGLSLPREFTRLLEEIDDAEAAATRT
jgi:hypothetical protein